MATWEIIFPHHVYLPIKFVSPQGSKYLSVIAGGKQLLWWWPLAHAKIEHLHRLKQKRKKTCIISLKYRLITSQVLCRFPQITCTFTSFVTQMYDIIILCACLSWPKGNANATYNKGECQRDKMHLSKAWWSNHCLSQCCHPVAKVHNFWFTSRAHLKGPSTHPSTHSLIFLSHKPTQPWD